MSSRGSVGVKVKVFTVYGEFMWVTGGIAPVILFNTRLRMWVVSTGWVYDLATNACTKTFVTYIAVTLPAPNVLVANIFEISICH